MDKNKRRLAAVNISFAHFFNDVFAAFLNPLTLYFIEKFALTHFLVGTLTVYMRIPCLLNPLIGIINNRYGLKQFIIWSPLVTAVFMSCLGLAPNYFVLSVMLLVAGISAQFFHVPGPVLIKQISKGKTGKYMGLFMVGGESARTLGPVIAVSAVTMLTLEGMYKLVPAAFLMGLYLSFAMKNVSDKAETKNNKNLRESLGLFFKKKELLLAILAMLFSKSFTASVITAYLPIYLKAKGFSTPAASSSLSIIAFSSLFGIMGMGTLSDKIGRTWVLIIYSILTPLSFLIFLNLEGAYVYPGLFVLGLITLSSTPVMMSLVQDKCADIPAVANGFYMTYNFLATSLIVLLGGKLSDLYGIEKAFYLCAFFSMAGLPILIITAYVDKKGRTRGNA